MMRNLTYILTAMLLLTSSVSLSATRKDSQNHYMVKNITVAKEDKTIGKYSFGYNSLGDIVKAEYENATTSSKEVMAKNVRSISFLQYDASGNPISPKRDYCYVVNDDNQIIFSSVTDCNGSSRTKVQNDYCYEYDKLGYGEYHRYYADNLSDEPKLNLGDYTSIQYMYPDECIWPVATKHYKIGKNWKDDAEHLIAADIEYWPIINNTNVEFSALYLNYSPYFIQGEKLAFLSGWMKLRSQNLMSKYGETEKRRRLEYTMDELNRPIRIAIVKDFPETGDVENLEYSIEYID